MTSSTGSGRFVNQGRDDRDRRAAHDPDQCDQGRSLPTNGARERGTQSPLANAGVATRLLSGFRDADDGGRPHAANSPPASCLAISTCPSCNSEDGHRRRGLERMHGAKSFCRAPARSNSNPTNGIVGNRDLIQVAVARDARQAIPLARLLFGQRRGRRGHGRHRSSSGV